MNRLLQNTHAAVVALRADALAFEASRRADVEAADPRLRPSIRNLLHYLSLRQHDIRRVQRDLQSLGLSSLGVIEAHVMASLNAVIANLERLAGLPASVAPAVPVDFHTGPMRLLDQARQLLGPARSMRSPRIMVTMPSDAATDETLLVELLKAGMDVMRINCAHDDPDTWRRMAGNLRRAEKIAKRRCRIQTDLAGPKLRTGRIGGVGNFLRVKPARDILGRTTAPAALWLVPDDAQTDACRPGPHALPVPRGFLEQVDVGDTIRIDDLRGRKRRLSVVGRNGLCRLAETDRSLYVGQGAQCRLERGGQTLARCRVGALPEVVEPIRLAAGDVLDLTRADLPGAPADPQWRTGEGAPAHVHCTLDAVFDRVSDGDRVWIDDGRIGGTVVSHDPDRIRIVIDQVPPGGAKLRAEKGINFPDTDLGLSALTDKDLDDLTVVKDFADIVALSFLRTPADLAMLQERLDALGARQVGIVLKIENATAFEQLPAILLASLRSPPVGVMVARGDLAVEVGFERLSELQEEILWLCEAAHVPVIWATQVLEGLAQGGSPSRAEISDVVMASRAECVMLNKGPGIVGTVAFLSDVLGRMESHHDKRMTLMRRLAVSDLDDPPVGAVDADESSDPIGQTSPATRDRPAPDPAVAT